MGRVVVYIVQDISLSENGKKVAMAKKGELHSLPRESYNALKERVPNHILNLTIKPLSYYISQIFRR